jgi:hypothetical protein
MSYELVLVLVPQDEAEPIERACELVAPFMHDEASLRCEANASENQDAGTGTSGPACGHHWDAGPDLGRRAVGILWRDRYGAVMKEHPITRPIDELRRVGDINLRATFLVPTTLITPDGECYFTDGAPHGMAATLADVARYEDRLAQYPDCLAVPIYCHS